MKEHEEKCKKLLCETIPTNENCSKDVNKERMKKPELKREFSNRHVHIAIRPSVYELLKDIANREGVSVSALVSYLIESEAYRRSK